MIGAELETEYRKAREPKFSSYGERSTFATNARTAIYWARQAIQARIQLAVWDNLDGFIIDDNDRYIDREPGTSIDCLGPVRLRFFLDKWISLDDLLGDIYTPSCHPEIPEKILAREKQAEIDRINRDGVWGFSGEYWHRGEWHQVDICSGFIGDDWRGSGYDYDIMGATLDAFRAAQDQDARDLEAKRPDMYERITL